MCKTVASHGFLEFVIPRNEQLSLREAPANVFWRTMAWNTSICKPFSVSGLPYYSTGQTWGSGPVWRGQDPGAAHWAIIPWAGGAWLIKGSFAGKDMYCNLLKETAWIEQERKQHGPTSENPWTWDDHRGWCVLKSVHWYVHILITPSTRKQPHFSSEEKVKLRDFKLASKGQGTNSDLDIFYSKPCMLYTTVHC